MLESDYTDDEDVEDEEEADEENLEDEEEKSPEISEEEIIRLEKRRKALEELNRARLKPVAFALRSNYSLDKVLLSNCIDEPDGCPLLDTHAIFFPSNEYFHIKAAYNKDWWIGRIVRLGCELGFIPSPSKFQSLRMARNRQLLQQKQKAAAAAAAAAAAGLQQDNQGAGGITSPELDEFGAVKFGLNLDPDENGDYLIDDGFDPNDPNAVYEGPINLSSSVRRGIPEDPDPDEFMNGELDYTAEEDAFQEQFDAAVNEDLSAEAAAAAAVAAAVDDQQQEEVSGVKGLLDSYRKRLVATVRQLHQSGKAATGGTGGGGGGGGGSGDELDDAGPGSGTNGSHQQRGTGAVHGGAKSGPGTAASRSTGGPGAAGQQKIRKMHMKKATHLPPYEVVPCMRPLLLIGPSLKGYELTDLLHKGLIESLKKHFVGRMFIAKTSADLSQARRVVMQPQGAGGMAGRGAARKGDSHNQTLIQEEVERIYQLGSTMQLVVLDCDQIHSPSHLSKSPLSPIVVYIKINSMKVLAKLIKSRGKSQNKTSNVQISAAEKLMLFPEEYFDFVIEQSDLETAGNLLIDFMEVYWAATHPVNSVVPKSIDPKLPVVLPAHLKNILAAQSTQV